MEYKVFEILGHLLYFGFMQNIQKKQRYHRLILLNNTCICGYIISWLWIHLKTLCLYFSFLYLYSRKSLFVVFWWLVKLYQRNMVIFTRMTNKIKLKCILATISYWHVHYQHIILKSALQYNAETYNKTCVREPPSRLTLNSCWCGKSCLSYKGTCHVILLAKLHDMYLYKTTTFPHQPLKSISKVAVLHRFYCTSQWNLYHQ